MHRRPAHSKRNNRLNVLIAGTGGSGKSTLINALCGGHEVASTTEWLDVPASQAAQLRQLKLRTYTEDMADSELGSVTLRMVETQGLGDNLDNGAHIDGVVKYLEGQFDEVLAEESRIKRNPRFTDSRVHAVVYLIEPTGHGLREQDVAFMARIGAVANVIPVLAKSDALTPAEVLMNKRLVYEDIEHYKIPIYQFYNDSSGPGANFGSSKSLGASSGGPGEEDDEHYMAMRKLQESLPLAIVASSKAVKMNGASDRHVLVRQYPWGSLNIEDPKVSEFTTLREILLYSHMEDLKETTNDVLYERYRTLRLSEDPNFNAAVSASSAPITASRANLAAVANGQSGGAPVTAGGSRVSSHSSAHTQNPHQNLMPQAGNNPYGPGVSSGPTGRPINPSGAYSRQVSGAETYGAGSRTVSASSAQGQEYVSRENRLREEEELLHRDEKLVQSELELRRQDLRRRELELKRLEEKLRQESQQLKQMQQPH